MEKRSGVCLAILAAACCLVSVAGFASASTRLDPQSDVSPVDWGRFALAGCVAAAEKLHASDDALAQKLDSIAVSREQSSLLRREAAARAGAETRGRRVALARLNVLLFGNQARFPVAGATDEDSFLDVLESLLGEQGVCAIEAIEATALMRIFGIPLNAGRAVDMQPDLEFREIDALLHSHLEAGESLEQAFAEMRPASTDDVLIYVEGVIREVLRQSAKSTGQSGLEIEHRLRQFLELINYASEPIRIQFFLDAKADAVMGALGVPLSENVEDRLFDRAQTALYGSLERMQQLRDMPPTDVLSALDPIVDRWFHTTVLPSVRRSLTQHPFAAYWFFVQSGGVAAPGRVFRGSRVVVRHPLFTLTDLDRLSLTQALGFLREVRAPADFLDRHEALEATFTNLTLTRDEVIARTGQIQPAAVARRVREFMLADERSSRISSLDVYSRLIRDASRIRGRVDRDLVAAAMQVFTAAKFDRLAEEIRRVLKADPSPDPRLVQYLWADAALMLELERRESTESRFQQSTSGAAVGWLLSEFFIGGNVPIELWAPQGVNGAEFTEFVDELTPKNRNSGADYHGKPASRIDFVHDGHEYHEALTTLIDSARQFLNISAFDWKTDTGGRDIAYRLMAKKLGIDGVHYSSFLTQFERGLPMDDAHPSIVTFYDIPTTRLKDLLVWYFFLTSDRAEVIQVRDALREAGATLECATVLTCGDLEALLKITGTRYDGNGASPAYDRAWRAYQQLETLFAERPPSLADVRPRRAVRDYVQDADSLRRLVRRVGLRRSDKPSEPFRINIVADAKQNLFNIHVGERSQQFPYFVTEPIRDIYFMLVEFDICVVLWKGPMEFPWHVGPVPVPGRKMLGVVPMPFIPWPWLNAVPGFGWAGSFTSVFLQYLVASDVRTWWGMVSHTKSVSTESTALESGMGMGSKYYNSYDTYKTWHDMGVIIRGAPVADVNDHFVQVFNEARVNNSGLPSSRGESIPALQYGDYAQMDQSADNVDLPRTWLLTTHPEQGDSNYRGVFVAALAAAKRNIYIENSFFSDPLIARMLIHKAREFRGRVSCDGLPSHACALRMRDAVQIYLVLPDSSDKPIVDAVGTADFHEMLRLGIKVHRWRPDTGWSATRMLHSKVWLVDYEPGHRGLVYVGAANATQRSHLADNEAGILSNDPDFAREVYERLFEPDITTASRVESSENFQIVRSANSVIRTSRWLRRLLVELFWFI